MGPYIRFALTALFTGLTFTVSAFAFEVDHTGPIDPDVPVIEPWKVVTLDGAAGGLWVVLGDVDGDGEAEVVSAENHNEGDVHYTSAVAVQELDGTLLWRWGDTGIGRKEWHHDVACQIHDWDNDGAMEVIVAADQAVVVLDGKTGEEELRFPIDKEASDCLVFCDLRGLGYAGDVLVKDRYHRIWAYTNSGELLWTVKDPGGYRTAHQPRPMDVDNDGRTEIMAGYALLNSDGTERWVYKSEKIELGRGHLDCARIYKQGRTAAKTKIVVTCCGANGLAMLNGEGTVLWELTGHHFESLQVGALFPDEQGKQIFVDIDHEPQGKSPLWVVDGGGQPRGKLMTDYGRHHRLVDWTGNGVEEMVVAENLGIFNHKGERIGFFKLPVAPGNTVEYEKSALRGDFDGDGVVDIAIASPSHLFIFRNEAGKPGIPPVPLGTGLNWTLY